MLYDVVIVGAGVSGLSAGALLAKAGRKVLVLEKNENPGGRAQTILYKGHILDNGPHGFSRAGHLEEIFSKIEKPFPMRYEAWAHKTETQKDGQWIDTREVFSSKALKSFIDEYVARASYEELESYDDVSLKDFVYDRTSDEGLRLVLWQLGQALCVESLYDQISAGETLFFIKEHLDKGKRLGEMGSVVQGGLKSVYLPLAQTIEENGGKIEYRSPVSDVIVEGGAVKGVEVERGEKALRAQRVESEFIEAPSLVVTTPVWELFDTLCEDDFPAWYVEMVNRLRHKVSYIWTIIYGTREPLWDVNVLRWIPMLPKTNYEFFSCCFNAYGEEAGEHQAHLLFQANFSELPSLFEMNRAKNRRAMKVIFRTFENEVKKLYPHVDQITNWKMYHTAAYSLAQAPAFVGKHRPEMIVPGVKNLFLVSDTIREGRGMGMQAAAHAALICADKILNRPK